MYPISDFLGVKKNWVVQTAMKKSGMVKKSEFWL